MIDRPVRVGKGVSRRQTICQVKQGSDEFRQASGSGTGFSMASCLRQIRSGTQLRCSEATRHSGRPQTLEVSRVALFSTAQQARASSPTAGLRNPVLPAGVFAQCYPRAHMGKRRESFWLDFAFHNLRQLINRKVRCCGIKNPFEMPQNLCLACLCCNWCANGQSLVTDGQGTGGDRTFNGLCAVNNSLGCFSERPEKDCDQRTADRECALDLAIAPEPCPAFPIHRRSCPRSDIVGSVA